MSTPINIIIDVSGSMNEMGKIHLQRNLCCYAAQLKTMDHDKYADIDVRFYQWAQSVSKIIVQNEGDIPPLVTEGSSSMRALSDFLSKSLNDMESLRVLILSDGNFDRDEFKSFLEYKEKIKRLLIRTVAVGTDSDLLKLKEISSNDSVYLSENIAAAIDCSIFGSDEPVTAPESTAQILQTKPSGPEEDWDA